MVDGVGGARNESIELDRLGDLDPGAGPDVAPELSEAEEASAEPDAGRMRMSAGIGADAIRARLEGGAALEPAEGEGAENSTLVADSVSLLASPSSGSGGSPAATLKSIVDKLSYGWTDVEVTDAEVKSVHTTLLGLGSGDFNHVLQGLDKVWLKGNYTGMAGSAEHGVNRYIGELTEADSTGKSRSTGKSLAAFMKKFTKDATSATAKSFLKYASAESWADLNAAMSHLTLTEQKAFIAKFGAGDFAAKQLYSAIALSTRGTVKKASAIASYAKSIGGKIPGTPTWAVSALAHFSVAVIKGFSGAVAETQLLKLRKGKVGAPPIGVKMSASDWTKFQGVMSRIHR